MDIKEAKKYIGKIIPGKTTMSDDFALYKVISFDGQYFKIKETENISFSVGAVTVRSPEDLFKNKTELKSFIFGKMGKLSKQDKTKDKLTDFKNVGDELFELNISPTGVTVRTVSRGKEIIDAEGEKISIKRGGMCGSYSQNILKKGFSETLKSKNIFGNSQSQRNKLYKTVAESINQFTTIKY